MKKIIPYLSDMCVYALVTLNKFEREARDLILIIDY